MKSERCLWIIILLLAESTLVQSQGVTRAHGIGFRSGFWKTDARALSITVNTDQATTVDVGGAGGALYFFSRITGKLFAEATLGAVGQVHVGSEMGREDNDVDVSAMVPVLLGLRYDLLPAGSTGSFDPYITGGTGTYWLNDTHVGGQAYGSTVSSGSDFFGGFFAGAGCHVMLRSWFGLNFDTRYHAVDFDFSNENSGVEIGFGMSFMWGSERELFRIRDVKVLVHDIYPAYYQFYSSYPVALLTIDNTAGYPIEVNVKSQIKSFSRQMKDSGFIEIPAGEEKDIPVYVFLGPELLNISSRKSAALDLLVEARAGVCLEKTISANLMLHSRDAWDGEINKLSYFVTPESDSMRVLRHHLVTLPENNGADQAVNLTKARRLFNLIRQRKIQYQGDPNIPFYKDDRVQFADNTLALGTGDCDDLAVLYASLLESVGIRTAFVDVQDPEKSMAHVYLMFDTGIAPESGHLISANEKKYVLRQTGVRNTLWIPVETTWINRPFDEAWRQGALQYLNDAVIRGGRSQGWVSVVDVR